MNACFWWSVGQGAKIEPSQLADAATAAPSAGTDSKVPGDAAGSTCRGWRRWTLLATPLVPLSAAITLTLYFCACEFALFP